MSVLELFPGTSEQEAQVTNLPFVAPNFVGLVREGRISIAEAICQVDHLEKAVKDLEAASYYKFYENYFAEVIDWCGHQRLYIVLPFSERWQDEATEREEREQEALRELLNKPPSFYEEVEF